MRLSAVCLLGTAVVTAWPTATHPRSHHKSRPHHKVVDGDILVRDTTAPPNHVHFAISDHTVNNFPDFVTNRLYPGRAKPSAGSPPSGKRNGNTSATLTNNANSHLLRWPGGVVVYEFAPGTPPNVRDGYLAATSKWTEVTKGCLTWRQRKPTDLWYQTIKQDLGDGCHSTLGRSFSPGSGFQGGFMNLDQGCDEHAYLHEVGHSIGLAHEQSRPDRDWFILSHPEATGEPQASEMQPFNPIMGTYDFSSVMHYNPPDFGTMSRQVLVVGQQIQNLLTPTEKDIAVVKFFYGCDVKPSERTPKGEPVRVITNLDAGNVVEVGEGYDASVPLAYISGGGGSDYPFEDKLYTFKLIATTGPTKPESVFQLTVDEGSHGRTSALAFAGGAPSEGEYTATVEVRSALFPKDLTPATVTVTVRVGPGRVCHNVRGDGGCGGHGTCVGSFTPWPCKCDKGWGFSECNVDVSCKGKGGSLRVESNEHRYIVSVPAIPNGDFQALTTGAVWGSKSATNGNGLRVRGATGNVKGGTAAGGYNPGGRIIMLDKTGFPTDVYASQARGLRLKCSPHATVDSVTGCSINIAGQDDYYTFQFHMISESVNGGSVKWRFYVNGYSLDKSITITTPSGQIEGVVLNFLFQIDITEGGNWGQFLYLTAHAAPGASFKWEGDMSKFGPFIKATSTGDYPTTKMVQLSHAGPMDSSSFFSEVELGCDAMTPVTTLPTRG